MDLEKFSRPFVPVEKVFKVNTEKLGPLELNFFSQLDVVINNIRRGDKKPWFAQENLILNLANLPRVFNGHIRIAIRDRLDHQTATQVPLIIEIASKDGLFEDSEATDRIVAKYYSYDNYLGKRDCAFFDLNYGKAQKAVNELIASLKISPEAKALLGDMAFREERLKKAIHHCKLVTTLIEEGFFNQWAAGEFTYTPSRFKTLTEIEDFSELTLDRMKLLLYTRGFNPKELKQEGQGMVSSYAPADVSNAQEIGNLVTQLMVVLDERIHEHECVFWIDEHIAHEQKTQAAQKLQEIADAAARARAEEESRLYAQFMAVPQFHEWSRDASEILKQLNIHAQMNAHTSKNAAHFHAAVMDTRKLVDIRDPNVQQLAEILFSAANLLAAADACSLEKQTKNFGVTQPISPAVRQELRTLYETSPQVQLTVNRLMNSTSGILLLSTLTCYEQRSKNYANALMQHLPTEQEYNKLASLKEALGPLSRQDLKDFANEPEVRAYTNMRLSIARKLAACRAERQALQGEIMNVFLGGKRTKVNHAVVLQKEQRELPSGWVNTLEKEGLKTEPSANGSKFLILRSVQYPELQTEIKITASATAFKAAIDGLRERGTRHGQHLLARKHLITDCGFQTDTTKKMLYHPEYGISVSTEDTLTLLQELWNANERFEGRLFEQESMIETLKRHSVLIEKVPGQPITFSHKAFGSTSLSRRGYFSDDDFAALDGLLSKINPSPQHIAALPAEDIASEAPSAPQKSQDFTPFLWAPDGNEHALLLDNTTLLNLSAARANGRTWLDLPKSTARLPNVKVLIPSVIADFEAQDKIPVYDAEGTCTGFDQVRPTFERDKPLQAFLASAARGKITKEGHFLVSPCADSSLSTNKNIIIVDTPKDNEAVYDLIREIMNGPVGQREERMRNEVYGKNHGEDAIDRVVLALPAKVGAVIISDDNDYIRRRAPVSTRKGMPISHATTSRYIDAAITAYEPTLRRELGETRELTLPRISDDIRKYWKGSERRSAAELPSFLRVASPLSRYESSAHTVYTLIKVGAKQREQEQAQTSPTRRTAKQRKKTEPKSIAPGQVRERPDSGLDESHGKH